jgi:hypothetical protein
VGADALSCCRARRCAAQEGEVLLHVRTLSDAERGGGGGGGGGGGAAAPGPKYKARRSRTHRPSSSAAAPRTRAALAHTTPTQCAPRARSARACLERRSEPHTRTRIFLLLSLSRVRNTRAHC